MRPAPWWALLSSGCAPVLLVSGWAIAAVLRGPGYDHATETISILAADGSSGRWVLTGALVALGLCHIVTARGLRPAALAGRVALAGGGVAVILLALSPAPRSGGSLPHGWAVGLGFALMAMWPVLAAGRGGAAPWALRPAVALTVCALMGAGAIWFLIELQGRGAPGVAERVLTTAQTLWPFVVVVSCLRFPRRHRPPIRRDAVD